MATVARSRIDFENNPAASKPANLANSAVLRMLEEEEEEQRRSGSNPGAASVLERNFIPIIPIISRYISLGLRINAFSTEILADGGRRSRSRYREIDRDTVLRINRHRPRRQFSWPPKIRSQSVGVAGGGVKGERRDLSLDSKLSHVGAAGATFAEDLSALQQCGEVAQQRRKGCLPPPKPRRQADNKSPAYRNNRGSTELDASHSTRARWHQNSSAKSQRINSQPKASDSGASDNLDTIQTVPRPTDSPPPNDWHSSADTDVVFTVIETPVFCLFCAAKDCLCPRREPLDLSEMEALAEASRRIVAEGEEELVREREAQELDAAIRELIDFASVVRKRPEIMNPAYIPIVEGCLQELAMLAMLHSQGRIGLRPETPRGAIEELTGNSSQSVAAPDTGICRNLPKLSDDLVGDNQNKRDGRESSTEALFAAERFVPAEGLRRVAWPPPSDVTIHPSQVPLQTNNHQPQSQQQYQPVAPASAPTPAATSFQNQQYQTQSYQTTTSYQATETQQQQHYYQPQVRQQSPGVITLRTELPVSQAPAPVYASQPPVFSFKGGSNMRGDQKWPPEEYKQQAALENEARLRLAAGPACRPRRANKDYTAFFAKNALSHNYPGYRVPPGTQHVNGQSMM